MAKKGICRKLFEIFKGNKKLGWLMMDSTYVKNYQHSCGDRGVNQSISKTKGDLIRKSHLVVNEYSVPINFIVTDEPRPDCKEVISLIENITAKLVFSARTCDTNEILSYLNKRNIKLVFQQSIVALTGMLMT